MNGYRTSYVTPAIRVVDAPISKKSPEQWKAIVEYKALAFTHDNNYASIAYDLKSSRATFDPNLAGGNGGFRCPVGTRYGGQITDRYGRGCGWGVARRLVNAIGDTARRAERGLDRGRKRRVQRRNARVARQIGVRGYTAPGRGGRGMATRLEDFADRRDRRQRRGRGGVASGPGVATRLEDFADRRDRRQGRGGRGVATRLEDFADRRDRRQGRGGRGVATRLEDFADRRDRRQGRGRGIATRLEDFADRDDRRRGIDAPERAPRTPKRPAKRPAAPNRRPRRSDAVAETATNRPRPKRPSTPVAEVKPPQRRQQGPRVNVDDLNSAEVQRLNNALDNERDVLNEKWKKRLGGEDPTPENIREYVKAREQRSKPGYVNTLKAMERDHAILNGDDRLQRANELAPSVRKRIIGGSIEDRGNARPQPPRAPRRPVKKRAVKKAAAKRPAKKAPAKKAAAKKAAATRPENESASTPDAPGAPGNPPETPSRQPQARKPAAKLAQRVTRKNEAKLGRLDKNGYGKPQRVEIGNKGISTQAQANKHLKDGGDLADVPDELLGKAIQSNAGNLGAARFKRETNGNGVNGMERYTDSITGKKIGLKYMEDYRVGQGGYGANEDINEIVGAHIAERFGFANGVMRFAGPTRHSGEDAVTPIVVELVDNYIGSKQKPNYAENWEVADLVRGQLLDAVILNTDRHGGNYFAKKVGNKHHFVPIDHGLGFNGRPGSQYSGRPNADGFREWLRDGAGGRRIQDKSFHPILKQKMRDNPALAAEVKDEILAMQRDLKKAHRQQKGKQAVDDILAAVPNRNPVTSGGRSHYDAIKRLEWLMNANPDEVLNLLKGN